MLKKTITKKPAIRKIAETLAVITAMLSLTGCLDQKIYERIGFIVNVGIDTSDDRLLVTYTYPIASSSESGGGQSGGGGESSGSIPLDVTYAHADLLREAREIANEIASRKLEGGKIQNVLLGKSLAEIGVQDYLEIFERDPRNPVLAWVIVVDGSASELINKGHNLKNKPPLGLYINQLIDDNSKTGYCPAETIIDFNVESSIEGTDPVACMVRLDKEGIRVIGSALFHKGKMTGQLDTQESAYLMIMKGTKKESVLYFEPPGNLSGLKEKAALSIRGLKSKKKVKINEGKPEVSFSIKITAGIDEYRFFGFIDNEKKEKLAEAAKEQITQKLQDTFEKLKSSGCDALGIGNMVHAYENDYWNRIGGKDGWSDTYPKTKATFNVEVKINNYGQLK